MKILTISSSLELSSRDIIDFEELKSYIPDECELHILSIDKEFKGNGHFKITLDVKHNGSYKYFSVITTDTMSIDAFWSDVETKEDIEAEARSLESLIIEVLKENDLGNGLNFKTNFTSIDNISFDELKSDVIRKAYLELLLENGYKYVISDDVNGYIHHLVNGNVSMSYEDAENDVEFQKGWDRECEILEITKLISEF